MTWSSLLLYTYRLWTEPAKSDNNRRACTFRGNRFADHVRASMRGNGGVSRALLGKFGPNRNESQRSNRCSCVLPPRRSPGPSGPCESHTTINPGVLPSITSRALRAATRDVPPPRRTFRRGSRVKMLVYRGNTSESVCTVYECIPLYKR